MLRKITLVVLGLLLASNAVADAKWNTYSPNYANCADLQIPLNEQAFSMPMTVALCTSEAVKIAHKVVFGRDIDPAVSTETAMVVSTEMRFYGMPTYGQLEERLERELRGTQYSIAIQPPSSFSSNDVFINLAATSLGVQMSQDQIQAAREYLRQKGPIAGGGGASTGWFKRFLAWLEKAISGAPESSAPNQVVTRLTPPIDPPTPSDPNNYRLYQLTANSNLHREYCFGAIGNQCNGDAPGAPVSINPDGTRTAWVSVGGIMHDTCCIDHPDGLHCKGADGLSMATDFVDDGRVCAPEWRKAVWNSFNRRMWKVTYGPYMHDVVDNLTWSTSPVRRVSVFDRWGGSTIQNFRERVATRLLFAPKGTSLDIADVQFCQSGRFVQTWGSMPMNSAYGQCE
jgi:hypothetical protein